MRALYYFIVFLARLLNAAILIRVLLTWIPVGRDSRFVAIIHEITEPILGPVRRVVPSLGGLDISPMLGLILVEVAERVLLTILQRVA